jgi:hypothetical protein
VLVLGFAENLEDRACPRRVPYPMARDLDDVSGSCLLALLLLAHAIHLRLSA